MLATFIIDTKLLAIPLATLKSVRPTLPASTSAWLNAPTVTPKGWKILASLSLSFWVEYCSSNFFIASVVLALKVAGLVLDSDTQSYKLYAKFENIGSLRLRAPVRIGGVLIGRVSNISLDKQSLTPVVELSIEQQYNQISSESKAAIQTSGIIGEQYISITPGFYDEDMGSEYFKDGDYFTDTGSALVLEDLISKFVFNSSQDKKEDQKVADEQDKE